MRAKVYATYFSLAFTIVSTVLIVISLIIHCLLLKDIAFSIIGSALVSLFISLTDYFAVKRETLEEIAKQLGVSRERVNQRRKRGIKEVKIKIDMVERKVLMGENKVVAFVESKEPKENKNILQQVNSILLEQLNTLKNLDLNDKEYSKMEIARSNAVSNTSKIILQTIGVQMMADRKNYTPHLQIENK